MNGIPLVHHLAVKSLILADAAGVKLSDVKLSDFDAETQKRFHHEADELIRNFINDNAAIGRESA